MPAYTVMSPSGSPDCHAEPLMPSRVSKLKIPTLPHNPHPCQHVWPFKIAQVWAFHMCRSHFVTLQSSASSLFVSFQHGSGTQQEPGQGAQALQVTGEAQEPEPGQGWLRRRFCDVRGEHAGKMMLLGMNTSVRWLLCGGGRWK